MGLRLEDSATELRRDLSLVSQEYAAEMIRTFGFIGQRVAPVAEVAEAEGRFPVLSRENFLNVPETARAEDGSYNRVQGSFSTLPFACEDNGLEHPVDDRRVRRLGSQLAGEQSVTRILTHKVLLAAEKRVADLVQDSSTYTFTNADTAWSTEASAVPLDDIATGLASITSESGVPAGMVSLILSKADFDYMVRTDQFLDQVKYTYGRNDGVRPALVSAEVAAAVCGVKEVLVGQGGYNSAAEGETVSVSNVWSTGEAMLAVLAEPNSDLETMSQWRTLLWTADSPTNPVVEMYREERVRGGVVRVRHDVDEVATAAANLLCYGIDTTAT